MTTLVPTVLTQILIMFFIILVGAICFKIKMFNKDTNKRLSDLLLMIVNPALIFVSYQREFNSSLLKGLLISLVLAFVAHMVASLISILFIRNKQKESDISIERFAVVYSNCGFIGIPLVNGIFGSEGVFYLTAYITVFNLFLWTHGVITITGKKSNKTIIAKAFLSPAIVATLLGFFFFIIRISLPNILVDSFLYIGNMNTPLAMMLAGATIAQTDIKKLFGKVRIYYVNILKLLLVPIIILLIFIQFDIPRVVLLTSVLAVSCPTAVTINLLSLRYGKNYLYATELFAVSTILSVITVPIVMAVAEYFVS